MPKTPKLTPNENNLDELNDLCVWQAQNARYLAAQGVAGPFEIGDKLYDFQLQTGTQTYFATRKWSDQCGIWGWINEDSGLQIDDRFHNSVADAQCGKPVAGPFGSFAGFQSDPTLPDTGLAHPSLRVPSSTPATMRPNADTQASPFRTDNDPFWSPKYAVDSDMVDWLVC